MGMIDRTAAGVFVNHYNLDISSDTWGFLLARTSSSPLWDCALDKAKEYLLSRHRVDALRRGTDGMACDLLMSRLRFEILDAEDLHGADDGVIRAFCNKWLEYINKDDTYGQVLSKICLTLEESSLEAIANTPDLNVETRTSYFKYDESFAVYFRAIDLDHVKDNDEEDEHGPCYRGWIRLGAMNLHELVQDLYDKEFHVMAPKIEYHGQIPMYDGDVRGHCIDPPGGTSGRLKLLGDGVPNNIWDQVLRVERGNERRWSEFHLWPSLTLENSKDLL